MERVNDAIRAIRHKRPQQPQQQQPQQKHGEMSHEQMKALAVKTLANTEHAISALKNELQRMAGHVVDGDHGIGSGNCEKPGVPDYHSMYSLKDFSLPLPDDSSSSSSSSSQESDTGGSSSASDNK